MVASVNILRCLQMGMNKRLHQEVGSRRGSTATMARPNGALPTGKTTSKAPSKTLKSSTPEHLLIGADDDQPKRLGPIGQPKKAIVTDLEPTTAKAAESAFKLTSDQAGADASLKSFLESNEKFLVLKGYAGTGKTTLVTRFLQHFYSVRRRSINVCLTATSNKAVAVLAKFVRETDLSGHTPDCMTCTKLLGLKPDRDKDTGKLKFVPDPKSEVSPADYDLIVVDECSMVDERMYGMLMGHVSDLFSKTKVIFTGDPAQLPPVNEKSSPSFMTPVLPQFNIQLREVVRYEGAVGLTAEDIRNTPNWGINPVIRVGHNPDRTKGVFQMPDQRFMASLSRAFNSSAYEKNADACRVIAYTNEEVDWLNKQIHAMRYGENAPRFVEGMTIVAKAPVKNGRTTVMSTSQEAKVIKVWDSSIKAHDDDYDVHAMEVEFVDYSQSENVRRRRINVLKECEYMRIAKVLAGLKQGRRWFEYWGLIDQFADIGYAYALTAHKAQGSTFDDVFILLDGLLKNGKTSERTSLCYVAFTRPRNRLFFTLDKVVERAEAA